MDVWEIDSNCEEALKRNLPRAKVLITDSYEEIVKTTGSWNLIIIDNPMSTFSGHCEHFDMFHKVFRVANNSSIIIMNVIPSSTTESIKRYPYLFNAEQLKEREIFYKTNTPNDVSFEKMYKIYGEYCKLNGFELEWSFVVQRTFIYYLVLKVNRISQSS